MAASPAPRLITEVVLPTPPLPATTAIRHGCPDTDRPPGRVGEGVPGRPIPGPREERARRLRSCGRRARGGPEGPPLTRSRTSCRRLRSRRRRPAGDDRLLRRAGGGESVVVGVRGGEG